MKKILSISLILIMIFNVSATAFATLPAYGEEYQNQPKNEYTQIFKDVDPNFWAFTYIAEMAEREVLGGYPNGNFYPNNKVSRAEFAKIMCLASGLTVNTVESTSYDDVKTSAWYAPFVECGKYYLSGYISDGKKYYKPDDKALREDIAVALVKLKGYDTSVYDESILKTMFTDWQSISVGARKYVSVAVENGLISGYEDNTFRGQASISRAEAATLLWRAYQYGNENKVFEKEEFEEPVSNSTSTDITTETTNEEKLKLILSVDNTNINVTSGEIAEFTATVEFNFLKNSNDDIPDIEYTPYIDGDVEILENMWGSEKNTANNKTVTLFRTKELAAGKYVLTVSVEDDYSISSEKVTINVTEPEPEYTYEMDTLIKNVDGVLIMIATNDSVVCLTGTAYYDSGSNRYLNYGKVIEVKNNKIQTLLDPENTGYFGNQELTKEALTTFYNKATVHALGYSEYDNCPYAIVSQGDIYLYNLYTKEVEPFDTSKYSRTDIMNGWNTMFCINELDEVVYGSQEFPASWYDGAITIDNVVYSTRSMQYIDNRTGEIKEIDYYIPGGSYIFAANNKYHYAIDTKSENIYTVDSDGEYEHLFSDVEIENVDKRKINLTDLVVTVENQNSAIDNNGIIYFYDREYDCVRCIRKKINTDDGSEGIQISELTNKKLFTLG